MPSTRGPKAARDLGRQLRELLAQRRELAEKDPRFRNRLKRMDARVELDVSRLHGLQWSVVVEQTLRRRGFRRARKPGFTRYAREGRVFRWLEPGQPEGEW